MVEEEGEQSRRYVRRDPDQLACLLAWEWKKKVRTNSVRGPREKNSKISRMLVRVPRKA